MNSRTKRRLIVVTGIVVVVLCVILAVVGGNSAAKTLTIKDLSQNNLAGERVQVTGDVVDNSFRVDNGVLTFRIYDPQGDPAQEFFVEFQGAASSTFGNGITAICTGIVSDDGMTLYASELVTKCPSKYESSEDAIGVQRLVSYGDEIFGKPVKMWGVITPGSLQAVGSDERFVVEDGEGAQCYVSVDYDGAFSEQIVDNAVVVVSGSLLDTGVFVATDVALKG